MLIAKTLIQPIWRCRKGGQYQLTPERYVTPQSIQHVIQLIDALITRQPLPDADGLIDSHLKLIPDSKENAQAVTRQINNDTQAVTNELLDALKLSESKYTVAPVLLDTAKDKP